MDKKDGNALADAMMKWALERGAVNYAHWFSPVRGGNGLKHDAFIDLDFGDPSTLKPIVTETFSNTQLFLNETDGSSFPNGGLRATHTAAAFMSWDRSSPPFVRGDTLYIPASFVSHYGDALDEKTPLLRSNEAINVQGLRLLKLLGDNDSTQVVTNVGWEQEFFCLDRDDYLARPDLMACGRTLMGAQPPRGQQTDYNYFNKINPRVKSFLEDCQHEMWKVGMSLSVYHNEVAPAQHEISPIFALTSISSDQNVLAMEIMEDVSAAHNIVTLFAEKPFAGLNGSGKHNNWGLNTDSGKNLYAPGKSEESQQDFFAFTAALARALHVHGDVVRTGVATAGNDHRLGAQEAPPAIISLYTGANMEDHIRNIVGGGGLFGYGLEGQFVDAGARSIAPIPAGMEDRNRTAPFPFCGNRFEFRAVGSNQNICLPLALLNTAVAESIGVLADRIEGGESPRDAIAKMFDEHMPVLFSGDGYSDAWPVEAEKRGLLNLRNSVDAYDTFNSEKNRKLFESQNVFKPHELAARQETMYEQYTNALTIEAACMVEMCNTSIIPACAEDLSGYEGTSLAGNREAVYTALASNVTALKSALDGLPDDEPSKQARYCADVIKPAMETLREDCDEAEGLIKSEIYPFPKYREMLFAHHTEEPQM